ncbi:MAG: hypothetical protein Q7S76_00170 [bacterium]|nr:hypothetical protein [bacterium]
MFDPTITDYFASLTGVPVNLTGQIEEARIANFCSGCDALQEDGMCRTVNANEQARYAAREFCGWASVNGVRGDMTSEGFTAS